MAKAIVKHYLTGYVKSDFRRYSARGINRCSTSTSAKIPKRL